MYEYLLIMSLKKFQKSLAHGLSTIMSNNIHTTCTRLRSLVPLKIFYEAASQIYSFTLDWG